MRYSSGGTPGEFLYGIRERVLAEATFAWQSSKASMYVVKIANYRTSFSKTLMAYHLQSHYQGPVAPKFTITVQLWIVLPKQQLT